MTNLDIDGARRSGAGAIGTLLNEAVSQFKRGAFDHALALLGISLIRFRTSIPTRSLFATTLGRTCAAAWEGCRLVMAYRT